MKAQARRVIAYRGDPDRSGAEVFRGLFDSLDDAEDALTPVIARHGVTHVRVDNLQTQETEIHEIPPQLLEIARAEVGAKETS